MKIEEIGFDSYKAFGSQGDKQTAQTLRLAPLTLLLGKNNSGKSAAARLPILLMGGLECKDERVLPLEVRGQIYGHNFLDIAFGGDFFSRPRFSLRATHGGEILDLDVTLFVQGALSAEEPPQFWSYHMASPERMDYQIAEDPRAQDGPQRNFLPSDQRWDGWRKCAAETLDEMVHLGPVRSPIAMNYSNETFVGFDLTGRDIPQLLRTNSALAEQVGSWYEEHLDGWRLGLQRDSSSFSLRIANQSKVSTNLAQAGEGLQQVLPVVSHQMWRQQLKSSDFLDVVEQPELHLHPAAQAPLADLFIQTALKTNGQTIVETNSEGILLRIQRRIAEGVISPSMVRIYFVEPTGLGSVLREIKLDEKGEMDWWPDGVFEEDFDEVSAIRRAQRKTSERNHVE